MSDQSRPNDVFIVGDNVGRGDFSCHGGLTPTPRIDALAREGIRFRNGNVAAQCTPTRCGQEFTGYQTNPQASREGL